MADTSPIQLIDADGEFCTENIEEFNQTSGLNYAGLKYQIVAIMGPQSSGKSTLMNHVFGTRFTEMDAVSGRRQTTRGIWMAKAPRDDSVLTIVLDLEGTDGRERGEDDTTFERQSALFALATADVVLINIWCHDIGREHGSGKPLIKTILQVNLKLFTPSTNAKKTVLVFAIRDKSRTPIEKLAEVLEQDMVRIWDTIIKPAEYENTSLHDFFEIYFEGLPNFEEKQQEFQEETKKLQKKFTLEGPETYVRLDGKLPGDAVPLSASKVWEVIKSHKDLDLPAHKIMVATTRCSQIQHDQLEALVGDGLWEQLLEEAGKKLHLNFGFRMSSLVDSCITGYDEDTMYFDADIRAEKREELVEKVTNLVKPLLERQLGFLHEALFQKMEKDLKVGTSVEGKGFSECATACKKAALEEYETQRKLLNVSKIEIDTESFAKKFHKAVDDLIVRMKQEKIDAIKAQVEKQFSSTLSSPMVDLLDTVPKNLWTQARQILSSALSSAESLKNKELEGYNLTTEENEQLNKDLRQMAVKLMKVHAKEAANTVLSRMKDRFSNEFNLDENKLPRTWNPKDNIATISKKARLISADVLAQLAIFQAEQSSPSAIKIEEAIREMAGKDFESENAENKKTKKPSSIEVNVAVEWPDVDSDSVLIQPSNVRSSWRQFMADSKMQITQASMTQHANRLASNRMPPIWAILAMIFLGYNEFVAVVFSPVLLLALIVVVLFIRSLYIEMDVDAEMQKGALPGAVSLAGKFVPSVKSVSQRTVDAAMTLFQQRMPSAVSELAPASTSESTSQQSSLRQRTKTQESATDATSRMKFSSEASESAKDK